LSSLIIDSSKNIDVFSSPATEELKAYFEAGKSLFAAKIVESKRGLCGWSHGLDSGCFWKKDMYGCRPAICLFL